MLTASPRIFGNGMADSAAIQILIGHGHHLLAGRGRNVETPLVSRGLNRYTPVKYSSELKYVRL